MTKTPLLLASFVATVLLSGCGSVRIGRITSDPTRYVHRTVQVEGTVTNSVGLLGTGGYQVDDGTGKIYVISNTGVPSRGSRVKVSGTVMSGAVVGGHAIGTALREYHHKVHY